MDNATLVADFIHHIWNNRAFDQLDRFLHPDFTDHSLPPSLPPGQEGTRMWIRNTGKSFDHHTVIEDGVSAGNQTIIRISMHLKHTGTWRDIEPTGAELITTGYRQFRLKDGLILEHRALIDGQAIENGIRNASAGCTIAR